MDMATAAVVPLSTAIVGEATFLGPRVCLARRGGVVDWAVLVPLALIGVRVDVAALCGVGSDAGCFGVVHLAALWQLT